MIDLHDRFALLNGIFVFFLSCCQFRLKLLHLQARAHRALVERPESQSNENPEYDEDPSVTEIESIVHPEQTLDHLRGNRMDDTLQEAPSVRIHVIEVTAHPYESLR